MGFPKFTNGQVRVADEMQHTKGLGFAALLQAFTYFVVCQVVTAGSTGATAVKNAFIAPTKLVVDKVKAQIDVVQTGTGNTPTVELYNLTKTEVIAVSGAVALSGAIGDVIPMTITAAYADVNEGDVLQTRIVNPAGTITVALQAHVEVEWHSVV